MVSSGRSGNTGKTDRIKLFCLPYAGSSASIYNKWNEFLNEAIELKPVELAGRGKRFKETLYSCFDDALLDLSMKVKHEIDDTPFAFFGHSLGCMLAYEIINRLNELYGLKPIHAFFSARYPPHINKKSKLIGDLNDEELVNELFRGKYISRELYEDKEMHDIFIPILRADFRVVETYEYIPKGDKLSNKITTLLGTGDEYVTPAEMKLWDQYTYNKYSLHLFEGGHQYISDKWKDIVQVVNHELAQDID